MSKLLFLFDLKNETDKVGKYILSISVVVWKTEINTVINSVFLKQI